MVTFDHPEHRRFLERKALEFIDSLVLVKVYVVAQSVLEFELFKFRNEKKTYAPYELEYIQKKSFSKSCTCWSRRLSTAAQTYERNILNDAATRDLQSTQLVRSNTLFRGDRIISERLLFFYDRHHLAGSRANLVKTKRWYHLSWSAKGSPPTKRFPLPISRTMLFRSQVLKNFFELETSRKLFSSLVRSSAEVSTEREREKREDRKFVRCVYKGWMSLWKISSFNDQASHSQIRCCQALYKDWNELNLMPHLPKPPKPDLRISLEYLRNAKKGATLTVLVFHGIPGTAEQFRILGDTLNAKCNVDFIVPTFPGEVT